MHINRKVHPAVGVGERFIDIKERLFAACGESMVGGTLARRETYSSLKESAVSSCRLKIDPRIKLWINVDSALVIG